VYARHRSVEPSGLRAAIERQRTTILARGDSSCRLSRVAADAAAYAVVDNDRRR
jgi:hypothetical protein